MGSSGEGTCLRYSCDEKRAGGKERGSSERCAQQARRGKNGGSGEGSWAGRILPTDKPKNRKNHKKPLAVRCSGGHWIVAFHSSRWLWAALLRFHFFFLFLPLVYVRLPAPHTSYQLTGSLPRSSQPRHRKIEYRRVIG